MVWDDFSGQHHIGVRESLLPGATDDELDQYAEKLGVDFPPAFRMLYRVHNGQTEPGDDDDVRRINEPYVFEECPPITSIIVVVGGRNCMHISCNPSQMYTWVMDARMLFLSPSFLCIQGLWRGVCKNYRRFETQGTLHNMSEFFWVNYIYDDGLVVVFLNVYFDLQSSALLTSSVFSFFSMVTSKTCYMQVYMVCC